MLEQFENWFSAHEPQWRQRNWLVSITQPAAHTDNSCAYADIETADYLARATVWESGEYQEEAIIAVTGESLFYEYKLLRRPEELAAMLEAFVEQLERSIRLIPVDAEIVRRVAEIAKPMPPEALINQWLRERIASYSVPL